MVPTYKQQVLQYGRLSSSPVVKTAFCAIAVVVFVMRVDTKQQPLVGPPGLFASMLQGPRHAPVGVPMSPTPLERAPLSTVVWECCAGATTGLIGMITLVHVWVSQALASRTYSRQI